MVVIFLKSKCFSIKLKCSVGDPDRYWNIGRKRLCVISNQYWWGAYYWSKEVWVVGNLVHGCSKENFC
jgi:hypothetical protein